MSTIAAKKNEKKKMNKTEINVKLKELQEKEAAFENANTIFATKSANLNEQGRLLEMQRLELLKFEQKLNALNEELLTAKKIQQTQASKPQPPQQQTVAPKPQPPQQTAAPKPQPPQKQTTTNDIGIKKTIDFPPAQKLYETEIEPMNTVLKDLKRELIKMFTNLENMSSPSKDKIFGCMIRLLLYHFQNVTDIKNVRIFATQGFKNLGINGIVSDCLKGFPILNVIVDDPNVSKTKIQDTINNAILQYRGFLKKNLFSQTEYLKELSEPLKNYLPKDVFEFSFDEESYKKLSSYDIFNNERLTDSPRQPVFINENENDGIFTVHANFGMKISDEKYIKTSLTFMQINILNVQDETMKLIEDNFCQCAKTQVFLSDGSTCPLYLPPINVLKFLSKNNSTRMEALNKIQQR